MKFKDFEGQDWLAEVHRHAQDFLSPTHEGYGKLFDLMVTQYGRKKAEDVNKISNVMIDVAINAMVQKACSLYPDTGKPVDDGFIENVLDGVRTHFSLVNKWRTNQ